MSEQDFREASLRYHREPTPGKLAIQATTQLETQRDLAHAYSPGVAYACEEIVRDPLEAANLTARGNLVAVISNGTAVLGMGNIGALASKPVMEGKAVLLKRFSNIDVFDIEIDVQDPDAMINVIAALEPTFGGIILEDIKAPECFVVEKTLRERMSIPVFHDDQHGTAVVSTAAVIAWLRLSKKKIEEVKLVISGAGSASMACADLIVSLGLKRENVLMCDSKGLIYKGREEGMNEFKANYAVETDKRTLTDALEGADIFFGLSTGNCVTKDMLAKMAPDPLVLAMANPEPEIRPELTREVWPNAVIGTGRSDYPNQVNNVLCFPFLFRGALDCGATTINEEMKLACAKALVDLAMQESTAEVAKAYSGETLTFGPDYIIPKPFDPRLIEKIPVAVVQAAMDTGVATRPIEDMEAYRRKLHASVTRSAMFMQPVIEAAQNAQKRLVFAEGENQDVLHAVQSLVDDKIVRPILLGRPDVILKKISQLGLRLRQDDDIELVDPASTDSRPEYWQKYHALAGRRGVDTLTAQDAVRQNTTILAALMALNGDADGIICGKSGRFQTHLRHLLDIIGPLPRQRVSSLSTLLLPSGPLFLTDCFIGVNPDIDELVSITSASIEMVQRFGITPRVALLSHSNFGTSTVEGATKMRKAAAILQERFPDVEIDGEMHAMAALDPANRAPIYQHSMLSGAANLLVFPNLDAANIALDLIRSSSKALLVGPFLSGLALPAHVLVPQSTARGIFNISTLAVADSTRQL